MRKKSMLLVPRITAFMWLALFLQSSQATPTPAEEDSSISLDDFEAAAQGWEYVGGWEFPGAKGSLEWDTTTAHNGKGSLRLDADFSKGGAYVGIWKVLPDFKGQYLKEIRLWVKSTGAVNIGVRILDDTDQCHQKKRIPLAKTDKWQEVVLRISDLVGEESWGGANDAKWHGPAKAFGLNIGTDSLTNGSTKGTLWLDDATCTLSTGPAGTPTVLACRLSQPSCRPGFGVYLTYRWDAVPMGRDFTVFVHFRGTDGRMAFQNDHSPPIATAAWSGRVEYEQTIVVPTTTPEGEYNIMLGIYDPKHGGGRQPLKVGDGVVAAENDPTAYRIGVLKVDAKAPVPKLPDPTLNLKGYHLTFSVTGIEIDVLEQYGVNPNALCTNVHLWYPDKTHKADGRAYLVTGMTDDFHNYGVMVDSDFIIFYYDGVELRRVKTPPEAKVPLYILVDLALGGGWPIDKTPNPSYMYVDYVRAYSK